MGGAEIVGHTDINEAPFLKFRGVIYGPCIIQEELLLKELHDKSGSFHGKSKSILGVDILLSGVQ